MGELIAELRHSYVNVLKNTEMRNFLMLTNWMQNEHTTYLQLLITHSVVDA